MTPNPDTGQQVDQFILEEIESVPHLEALLLIWNNRPKPWSVEEMAAALYVPPETAGAILQLLQQSGFVTSESDRYMYDPASTRNGLLQELDRTYRRELVRVSRMIHSKGSPAVREFARAFKLKKD